jgi:GrpB-like predicted nucleotidyltransferase (UPF0157 family)
MKVELEFMGRSPALGRHILFRDYLRKHDDVRREYEIMKLELAQLAEQDKKAYPTLKEEHVNPFIDTILVRNLQEPLSIINGFGHI